MADLRSQYGIGRGDISYDPNSISMYAAPATASYTPPYTETPAATSGGDLMNQYYGNIQSALSGELPEDVKNQISTAAAEYGIATGMPGSQLAGYAGLRNLGLTSLARQDWAAKMLQPNISSQLDINRLKTQAELEQENWMQRYEAQLAEKRRQDYLNKNLGGGTPPIVQGHAGAPTAPMMGGGYRPSSSGYGTGFGTFGTPEATSNQAVMNRIMQQYGPQTSTDYGTQEDYGMPASSAANYAALAGGTAAGMMGGFGALGGLAGLMGSTEGMTGYQNPYQGTPGGWGDENADFWIPQE